MSAACFRHGFLILSLDVQPLCREAHMSDATLQTAYLHAGELAECLADLSAAEVSQVLGWLRDEIAHQKAQQEAQAAAGQRRSYQPSEASERYQPRA